MSQVSTGDVVDLFKNVYGDLQNLLPEDYMIAKDIPFEEKQKVGDKYIEGVVLSHEVGWTLGGNALENFTLNPAIAGAVRQAEVSPYMSVLASVVPWGVISRSAGGGKQAFFSGTKHIVKNNLRSHGKLLEILRLYGQSSEYLGSISYATATYRGVSFTNGTGTLSVNGTNVTFTNGVNTSSKHILFQPGQFAAGIWIGMNGVLLEQIDSSGNVVASGKLVSVDALKGVIQVDFTPIAATAENSHFIGFQGMAAAKDQIGIHKILSTVGTLFGIPNTQYELFQGNIIDIGNVKFTLSRTQDGVATAVNKGGLDKDLDCYVNPRTWATMVSTEAGARQYDDSYKPSGAENGFENITFYAQNGRLTIKAHRFIKEGHAAGLCRDEWSRSGSAEVSFQVPGIDKEIIFPLENQAAMAFRSYADQYMFCYGPSKSIFWTGINDEATS